MEIYLALRGDNLRKHVFQSLGRLSCHQVPYPHENGGTYGINP